MEEVLIKKIQENFGLTYLSKFETFDEVVHSNDCGSLIGLRDMLEKLTFETGDPNRIKEIRKLYNGLISMNDQTPEIDYPRYDSIKAYFKVFENKLAQAGPSLVTLHKATEAGNINNSTMVTNLQASQLSGGPSGSLPNIPILSIRKIANSANFNTAHSRTVYAMLKLPGKKLCTGADDGFVKLFDLSTFQTLLSFQAHQSGIRSMITLANGQLVTGSYDKTIRVWANPLELSGTQTQRNATSRQQLVTPLKTLMGHSSCVIALRAVGDGNNMLASGSADYSIKIWDLEKGEVLKNLTGHLNDVLCFASTSNGQNLLSGSADRTIKLWNLNKKFSSACLKTLTGHTDFVWTLALLPDDTTLFSGGLDKVIRMWDVFSGTLTRMLPVGHSSHITRLWSFSVGVICSSSNDGTVKFWDYAANSCIHTLEGPKTPISTFIVGDDNSVLSAGQDKLIYVWD